MKKYTKLIVVLVVICSLLALDLTTKYIFDAQLSDGNSISVVPYLFNFKLVHNYLNPDGLYIFDISTIYKFRHILGNNTFTDETETEFFVWQNNYEDRLLTMDLDIFYQEENGSYGRVSETHYERGYTISEISKVAEKCGFKVEGVFDEFSFKPAHAKSERIFFVIRSIKK